MLCCRTAAVVCAEAWRAEWCELRAEPGVQAVPTPAALHAHPCRRCRARWWTTPTRRRPAPGSVRAARASAPATACCRCGRGAGAAGSARRWAAVLAAPAGWSAASPRCRIGLPSGVPPAAADVQGPPQLAHRQGGGVLPAPLSAATSRLALPAGAAAPRAGCSPCPALPMHLRPPLLCLPALTACRFFPPLAACPSRPPCPPPGRVLPGSARRICDERQRLRPHLRVGPGQRRAAGHAQGAGRGGRGWEPQNAACPPAQAGARRGRSWNLAGTCQAAAPPAPPPTRKPSTPGRPRHRQLPGAAPAPPADGGHLGHRGGCLQRLRGGGARWVWDAGG